MKEIKTTLPTLELIEAIDSAGDGYFTQNSEIAIGPDGRLVITTPFGRTPMVSRLPGGPSISFGARGGGPGEFRSPLVYEVTESTVVLFDRSTARLSEWTTAGELVGERTLRAPVVSNVASLSGRGWLMASAGQSGLRLLLLDRTTGVANDIIPPADSFVRAHWSNPTMVVTNPPAFGPWVGGVVLAQRTTYELAFYDHNGNLVGTVRPEREGNVLGPEAIAALERSVAATGKRLSPARRAALATDSQPWIQPRIRSDGAGRTWTLGQHGDEPFFDVFAGPSYLGRLPLRCPGLGSRWDLSGQWLTVICAPTDPTSSLDAEIRVFRITER